MRALISIHENPFEPRDVAESCDLEEPITIRQWLRRRYGEQFEEFEYPTLCLIDGNMIGRSQWDSRPICNREHVAFVRMAGTDPMTWLYIITAVVAIFSAYVVLTMPTPITDQRDAADSVWSLDGQRNQNKLGQPIEVIYGKPEIWPSYAANPYTQYIGNEQWLFQLFCLGHGEFEVEQTRIEDTNMANFSHIEHAYYGPADVVTLFPTTVENNNEVGNLYLPGMNEPDPGWKGPFVANSIGTDAFRIEADFVAPHGVFEIDANGKYKNWLLNIALEVREIDDTGAPIGGWIEIARRESGAFRTTTPQRYTLGGSVLAGRWEARAQRFSNALPSDNQGQDDVFWTGLRAYRIDPQNYGNVTKLAVKAKATNNLNNQSANRINVVGTRKIPVWDSVAGDWTAPTATRNPVWAFCDLWRNAEYGGALADQFLNMQELIQEAADADARGDTFDHVFDQSTTIWEAAKVIARAMRAQPVLEGSRITLVRDSAKTIPTAVFNQHNIVSGSFRREIQLVNVDEEDGFDVEYWDSATGKRETVLCKVAGEEGDRPQTMRLEGVRSRTKAYREGMYMRSAKVLQRENVAFSTGLEGALCRFGDLISVAHDTITASQSGLIVSISGTTVNLREAVSFKPDTVHGIILRKKDGSATGPHVCAAGANSRQVILGAALADSFFFDEEHEPPYFQFGPIGSVSKLYTLLGVEPAGSDDVVELRAVNYAPAIHGNDGLTAPPYATGYGLPKGPALPEVSGLSVDVSEEPGYARASWGAAPGARYYVVEVSYDNEIWEFVGATEDLSLLVPVPFPATYYIRVSGVNVGAGPADNWSGAMGSILPPTGVSMESGAPWLSLVGSMWRSGLLISWNRSQSVTATGYDIEYASAAQYAEDPPDWVDAGSVTAENTKLLIERLHPGTNYYARVRARSGAQLESSWAQSGPHTLLNDTLPPPEPSGITALVVGNRIEWSWADNSAPDYAFTRINGGRPYQNAAVFIFNGRPGTYPQFTFRAYDTSGNESTPALYELPTPLGFKEEAPFSLDAGSMEFDYGGSHLFPAVFIPYTVNQYLDVGLDFYIFVKPEGAYGEFTLSLEWYDAEAPDGDDILAQHGLETLTLFTDDEEELIYTRILNPVQLQRTTNLWNNRTSGMTFVRVRMNYMTAEGVVSNFRTTAQTRNP